MEYGIVFWGNLTESKKVFQLQKKVIRIMTGSESRISCKSLFQSLEILTLPSQYRQSLMEILPHNLKFMHLTSEFMVLIQKINCNCID